MARPLSALRIAVVCLVALLSACAFDGSALEDRQCSRNNECDSGFYCLDGYCQIDNRPDVGTDVTEDEPQVVCIDRDNDGVPQDTELCDYDGEFDCDDDDATVFPGNSAGEICDRKDNDCDGQIDTLDDDYVPVPCAIGDEELQGVCRGAIRRCIAGELDRACGSVVFEQYAAEQGLTYVPDETICDEVDPQTGLCTDTALNVALCDGVDNDCDGQIDESLSFNCYDGQPQELLRGDDAICRVGQLQCVDGAFVNADGAAVTVTGDGEDAVVDCDGAGQITAVANEAEDPALRCNGADDDCDGQLDEGCTCTADRLCFPGNAQSRTCNLNITDTTQEARAAACQGVCVAGIQRCIDGLFETDGNGDPVCTEFTAAVPETCDNLGADDDCNGTTDDIQVTEADDTVVTKTIGADCTPQDELGDMFGVCGPNTFECFNGEVVCDPLQAREIELCADLNTDNDCDGSRADVLFQCVALLDGTSNCDPFTVILPEIVLIEDETFGPVFDADLPQTIASTRDCDPDNPEADDSRCCDTGRPGVCQWGQWSCNGVGEAPALCQASNPGISPDLNQDSQCDGLDDDCDGFTDEDNPRNSDIHCGQCGSACGAPGDDLRCCLDPNGVNPTPGTDEDTPFSCFDTLDTDIHCGQCGNDCTSLNLNCCDGGCVDFQNDNQHCGECGIECADNEGCCNGQCLPLDVPTRCGACDLDCADVSGAGSVCCSGALICATSQDLCP